MRVSKLAVPGYLYLLLAFSFQLGHAMTDSVEVGLFDNPDGVPVIELIDSAESTIDIEIYEMNDPNILKALRKALKRKVAIRVVKEPTPVGSSCRIFEKIEKADDGNCADQKMFAAEVRKAGGTYVPFAKPALCGGGNRNCLEHGKLLIVDSQIALVSTGNFNSTSFCNLPYHPETCNRDYTFLSDDPAVVKAFSEVVERDIEGVAYDVTTLLTDDVAEKITIGPHSLDPIVNFIDSAKRTIHLENQYLKEPTMNQALLRASKRGVDVKAVIESPCHFGPPSASEKQKLTAIFQSFDHAGIATRAFNQKIQINGKPGYLHAKAIVVDGKAAWVGSVNGSTQAATINREFGVFFKTASEVTELSDQILTDYEDPNVQSWKEALNCERQLSPTYDAFSKWTVPSYLMSPGFHSW